MASVRKKYGDRGNRLIEALHLLVFGTPAERKTFFGETVKTSAKDRRECLEILLERGYGKVPNEVEVSGLQAFRAPQILVVTNGIPRPVRPALPETSDE